MPRDSDDFRDDWSREVGNSDARTFERVRPSGIKNDQQLRRDRSTEAGSEGNAAALDQQRTLVYNHFIEGLSLSFVNTTTIDISPGSFGARGQIYTCASAREVSARSLVGTALDRWVYVFLAYNQSQPSDIAPYLSRDFFGRDIPAGFNGCKRIGVLLMTSTFDGFERFVQSGTGVGRSYEMTPHHDVIPDGTLSQTMTLYEDVLPMGLTGVAMYFDYQAAAGPPTQTITSRVVPDSNNLTAAEIQSPANTAQIALNTATASTSVALHSAFLIVPNGRDLWAQYTTDGTTGFAAIEMSGYTDDVS